MNVLSRKLWRTIWNTKGQFLAVVAVVMVGISVYISMSTAFYNLNRSVNLFYEENNFGDYYFHVIRAPVQITRQIESVPGVMKATGRIQKDVPVMKENDQRATVRLTSFPLPMEDEVNRLQLLTGRLFEKYPQSGGVEILLDPQYAQVNGLLVNNTINVVAEGKQVPLTVVGTATSPEFIYPMKDAASLMPEPKSFGIVMLPQNQAEQVLNMTGQINQVVLKLTPGVNEKKVAEQVKSILKPYGNLADYPRKQQLSNAVMQGELDGLKAQGRILPVIFLVIAAFIQLIMLGRMIKSQRLQIGVMKALGYDNRQIMLHYTGYSLMVALAGALLGTLLGLLLASVFSQAYAQFFNLPEAIGGINLTAIGYGFSLSFAVGAAAGLTASRGVVAVNPADAMRAEPPKSAHKLLLERWNWLWRKLAPAWKMSLRSVLRNRERTGMTLLGVVFAVGMLVMSFFAKDSIDYMLKTHFYQEQHYDYLLRFASPVREGELFNISRLEGVTAAEPIFEVPVKVHFEGRSEDDLLLGLPLDVSLKSLTGEQGQPLQLPEEGVLISQRTAAKLGVQVGDRVTVETLLGLGPSRSGSFKIAGINRQLVGSGSFVTLAQANRVLQERRLISGAMLKVDPGKTMQLEKELNEMTGVSSILSRQKELENFNQNLGTMIYSISIMIIFSVILGFAIVYNSSVISFGERKRELASLRVVGFTSREVSGLLLKENLLQTLAGVALGLPFGKFISEQYMKAVSTDLFTLPVVVYPLTYVLSAAGGIFFIMVAHLFAAKGVKRLDLVEVLKNRD
jgi:putative ABC transport system permease protein